MNRGILAIQMAYCMLKSNKLRQSSNFVDTDCGISLTVLDNDHSLYTFQQVLGKALAMLVVQTYV